jgi:hypothetical protein
MKLLKTHKLKIKKLESENEALSTASKKKVIEESGSVTEYQESVMFWDLINRKSRFQKTLAKCAVSNMCNIFVGPRKPFLQTS